MPKKHEILGDKRVKGMEVAQSPLGKKQIPLVAGFAEQSDTARASKANTALLFVGWNYELP
jgi:hypothetical protein